MVIAKINMGGPYPNGVVWCPIDDPRAKQGHSQFRLYANVITIPVRQGIMTLSSSAIQFCFLHVQFLKLTSGRSCNGPLAGCDPVGICNLLGASSLHRKRFTMRKQVQ